MKNDRNDRKERLEAIGRELAMQDEELQRLYAMAAKLGDVEIAVPRDALDQINGKNKEPATPVMGVRA